MLVSEQESAMREEHLAPGRAAVTPGAGRRAGG